MLPKTWKELYAAARIFNDHPSHHHLRTYLIDGPFLNQKNI